MPVISNSKNSAGYLLFFSEPLCYLGAVGLAVAASIAFEPRVDPWAVLGVTIIALSLLLCGLASVQSRRHDLKNKNQFDHNRALHPESPWLWRDDWSQGHVQSELRSSTKSNWVVALLWCMFSGLILANALNSNAGMWEMLGTVALTVAGVVLLVLAVIQTIRMEKFGKAWLDLATLPGVIGKELRGSIHVNFSEPPEEGVVLKLNCTNLEVISKPFARRS
jgi:hypothetical protein